MHPFLAGLTAFAAWIAPWLLALLRSTLLWTVVAVVFKDVIFSVIGDIFGMGANAINSVGIDIPTLSEVVDEFPLEAKQVLKRVGLDTCMAMIVSAYAVRGALSLFGTIKSLKPRS